jgi:hypothetical protein
MSERPAGEIPVFPISEFRLVRRQQGEDRPPSRILQQRFVSMGGMKQPGGGVRFWRDEWRDVPIFDEEDL